jgi:type III secretion protein U
VSEGEEKTEEASAKKLREAREEGEIAGTKDFKDAALLAALLLYALFGNRTIINDIRYITDVTLNYGNESFDVVLSTILPLSVIVATRIVLPFIVIYVTLSFVISIVLNKGLLFALKPITPDLNRINPVEGFKNIFAERAWIELAKALFLLVALGSIFFIITRGAVKDLADLPSCGFECIGPALYETIKPLVIAAILVLLIAGVIDLPLQNFIFLKQQRMTKTDVKREKKESYGSPELQRERKRLEREARNAPNKLGIGNASLIIYGPDNAVGVRYVDGETPVPLIVARSRGRSMTVGLRATALRANIPQVADTAAAVKLSEELKPGSYIREQDFGPVIDAFRSVGLF